MLMIFSSPYVAKPKPTSFSFNNVSSQTRPIFQRLYATGSGNNSLLVVEHRNGAVDGATLNALTAAQALGGDITAIVAGDAPESVAKEIAKYNGITKVLLAKNDAYAYSLPETLAPLLVEAQKKL